MKRKEILAKAIILGLLLAVPCGAMAADLTINGDSLTEAQKEAGWALVGAEIYHKDSVSNNNVTFLSGNLAYRDHINGAYEFNKDNSKDYKSQEVYGNTVNINGGSGSHAGSIRGGYSSNNLSGLDSMSSNVHDNTVNILSGSTFGITAGESYAYGRNAVSGEVYSNTIRITGGNVGGNFVTFYAGQSYAQGDEKAESGSVYRNKIIIEKGDDAAVNIFASAIYAGYSKAFNAKETESGAVYDNEIIVKNIDSEIKADIYGGETNANAGSGIVTSGDVYNNKITIDNAQVQGNIITGYNYVNSDNAIGGKIYGNNVTITNAEVTNVTGGKSEVTGNGSVGGDIYNNQIIISHSNVGDIIGGHGTKISDDDTAITSAVMKNKIIIQDSVIDSAFGGDSKNNTVKENEITVDGASSMVGFIIGGAGSEVSKNKITVNAGEVASIYGGMTESGSVESNEIFITGGKVTGDVWAGVATANGVIRDNKIVLSGSADVEEASLSGYLADDVSTAVASGNALVIDGWRGTVGAMNSFNALQFADLDLTQAGAALSAADASDLSGTEISIVSLKEGTDLAVSGSDKEYTIIDGANVTFANTAASAFESIDTSGNGVRVHDVEAKTSENNFVAAVTKSVLSNVYVAEDGTTTSNELVIDNEFSTNASVVAGAYASGENKAEGGSVIIKGAYDGAVYAGYSENGEVGENIIALQDGADAGALYGSNTGVSTASLIVDGGDSKAKRVNNFATVDLGEKEQALAIGEMNGEATTFIVHDVQKNGVRIAQNNVQEVVVHGTSNVADGLNPDDMQQSLQEVIDVINVENGNKQKLADIDPGKIMGRVQALSDENGNIVGYKEEVNPANQGISEMASIALMTWRQENNDMNKRLGELRDSAGEHGVWVRMTRGESKYGNQNIKNQYNAYQLGYDEKLSVDKHWTVGAALTYTDAESSFRNGKGENKHKGLALYGSRLNDDGSFIDLIARYARLEHDFEVNGGAGKGDFDTNGYSLSAEYGKRFTKDNGLWIEPQVELTYGRVSGGEYLTNNDVRVRQEGMDSLVGRLGFALGKNLAKNKGNVYLRASYLYDFDGETDVSFSSGLQKRGFTQDLGGGWWEVGIGANVNLSEASHLYFDIEKTYGGNVATPWQWNAGMRWSF